MPRIKKAATKLTQTQNNFPYNLLTVGSALGASGAAQIISINNCCIYDFFVSPFLISYIELLK